MSSPTNLNSSTRSLSSSDSSESLAASRSDSPLIEVTSQIWENKGKVWLDLVYDSRDAMRKFKATIEKMENIAITELLPSRTSEVFRCCLRIIVDKVNLQQTLACILDEHPEFLPPNG